MHDNPLSSLYRSKTVYIALPSKGKYYDSGLNLSIDDELGIMPMTAVDEIKLKAPDALFNGEALFDLIKSCVPDIKDPHETPVCDIDVILMAIRIATHGDKLGISSTCPACEHVNEFDVNLPAIMVTAKPIDTDNKVVINDSVTVYVRPYSLQSQIKGNIKKFQHIRMQLIMEEDMPDSAKAELFNEALVTASAVSVQLAADNILKVELKQPDNGEIISVSDRDHIFDWVENMDSETYNKVINKIKKLSDPKLNQELKMKCQECQNPFTSVLDLNPVNFFM